MCQLLQTFINSLLSAQADSVCGADYGTRTETGPTAGHLRLCPMAVERVTVRAGAASVAEAIQAGSSRGFGASVKPFRYRIYGDVRDGLD